MAHKKAAGSAKNLRDSNPKYRGLKVAGGQMARAGNIIIRQKGDKFALGSNVYKGKDFTIHAKIDGIVSFRKKNILRFDGRKYLRTVVDIVPADQAPVVEKTVKAKKTESKVAKTPAKKVEKVAEEKKAAPVKKAASHDLTDLEGVGPKTKEAFVAAGIKTCEDLAKTSVEDAKKALEAAGGRTASMDPTPWIEQAKSL